MSAKFQNKGEKDLFDQFQTADTKIRKKTKILLPSIKKSLSLSYENIIFITIGFVMSCIIFFSLGVEKGRQDIGRGVNNKGPRTSRFAPAQNAQESSRQGTEQAKKQKKKVAQQPTDKKTRVKDEYVVQLAAFKKSNSAKEEQGNLKKTGYHADIKRVGDFYQLYIGGFASKKKAEDLLSKLKTSYKDCYIKKR